MTTSEVTLAQRIALPSSVGRYLGEKIWGEPYVIFDWLAYAERRIVDAILDTTHERYIIVNAPPQVGKSSYVGILLPFWLTGIFPQWQIMYISYSDDFSTSRGKDVRQMHELFGKELFGTSISGDFGAAHDWRTSAGRGGMLSVGVGGLITGRPGHVIIIDDLIKNAQEAASQATKKMHLAEWDGTINRRVQPGGTVIIIATRWVEDDLSGALTERMKEPGYDGPQWEVIEFPAFADPPDDMELSEDEAEQWRDILGRKQGEVLDCRFSRIPGRAPEDFFQRARAGMDPFAFSCLYQQRPTAREGGMFPAVNWNFYDPAESPVFDREVRVWDLAATEGGGDWTCGTKVGRAGSNFYITDVRRFRKNAGGVQDEVKRIAVLDGYGPKVLIEEEKGGSGKSVVEAYRRLLVGHTVESAKAEGDKESRATPYSAEQNKRNMFLPIPGTVEWDVKGFIDEHKRMMGDGRRPKNDDRIDTAAYGMLELLAQGLVDIWVPNADNVRTIGVAQRHLMFEQDWSPQVATAQSRVERLIHQSPLAG
jgi:phage terminase large subunit-like protein